MNLPDKINKNINQKIDKARYFMEKGQKFNDYLTFTSNQILFRYYM